MSLIFLPMSIGSMSHVDLKKCYVALSIFRVKGPFSGMFTYDGHQNHGVAGGSDIGH